MVSGVCRAETRRCRLDLQVSYSRNVVMKSPSGKSRRSKVPCIYLALLPTILSQFLLLYSENEGQSIGSIDAGVIFGASWPRSTTHHSRINSSSEYDLNPEEAMGSTEDLRSDNILLSMCCLRLASQLVQCSKLSPLSAWHAGLRQWTAWPARCATCRQLGIRNASTGQTRIGRARRE